MKMASSTHYANQQFQPLQGLQPAIPFERPSASSSSSSSSSSSRTPLRARVETPIHPPQLPAPTPRTGNARPVPPARPRAQRPQKPQQPQHQTPHPPQQRPQVELDEHFRRAEQAYLAAYHPISRPPAVYHTIDPTQTTLAQDPQYVLYRAPPEQVAPSRQPAEPQQRRQQDLHFVHSRPPPATTQQPNRQAADAQGGARQDETMQEDGSSSDEDDQDIDENEQDAASSKPAGAAPLVQPITPLQYPAVRPTLLLGPYDTREEAQKATIEYGVAQGYMLVQSGCARAKTSWGGYDSAKPIVRLDYLCDRSGRCKNVGTGKRKRATHKIGCPTRIKVVCRKRDGCKWFIDPRCELHNHDLNLGNMDSIASYRRWRRLQDGGSSAETRRERSDRKKKARNPIPPAPVPPPTFHNAGPQPPSEPTGPVHMAALKGQVKILDILISRGADMDAYDATGRTALHCAIEGSRMDTFQLLVDRGASVSRCDSKGLSPLRMAVEKGMEDAVVLLIEKGADPNK